MHVLRVMPRVRLALARRPWLYWSFVALCALAAWAGVHGAIAAAQHRQQRWGQSRTVLVVTTAARRGQPIRASPRQYPAAMVPASALRTLPAGALAVHDLAAGEVVVAVDVAGSTALPSGWVVFGVPVIDRPALVAGDDVALFADGARWCDGTVMAVAEHTVDVAVPTACADTVSAQVAAGSVVLARA